MNLSRFSKFVIFALFLHQVLSITQEKLFTSGNKKVYYIENEYKYDWFEALSKFSRMNMTLLTIDSKTKSDDVNKLVQNSFGKNIVLWVGGYAVGANRVFTWVNTGEEFTFTYWHGDNPDFAGKEEYCIQIGWDMNMKWNDNKCTKRCGFICEFTPHECDENRFKSQNIIINNYQKN